MSAYEHIMYSSYSMVVEWVAQFIFVEKGQLQPVPSTKLEPPKKLDFSAVQLEVAR
ncbi:hypothetical protein OIU78_027274 [Salix suchowensis]|nr:hypothetical protein OIU78_027274 [Salix suchowensis]